MTNSYTKYDTRNSPSMTKQNLGVSSYHSAVHAYDTSVRDDTVIPSNSFFDNILSPQSVQRNNNYSSSYSINVNSPSARPTSARDGAGGQQQHYDVGVGSSSSSPSPSAMTTSRVLIGGTNDPQRIQSFFSRSNLGGVASSYVY